MNTEITWRPHVLTSSLHAAEAATRKQPISDTRLAVAIREPALQLASEIRAAQLPPARFWGHLIPLSATVVGHRQLVETAVIKTIGRGPRLESVISNLVACLAAIENAVRNVFPNLEKELLLRAGPLREQWEARGAGMLRQIAKLTEETLIPSNCTVVLVHPALGGGGEAHLAYNSARIEAVLANPVAELPEVVRLGWLIAQLQMELPAHSEGIHADRLPHVARYAMLIPALIAAEAVELVRFAPDELKRAVAAWRFAVPADVDAATLISDWWQTYQAERPPWRVALMALDQMFG
jgi:hypothetical protein